MRRNFISALPRKCAAFFLESPAPYADAHSRAADGRFQRPNPHRQGGGAPRALGGAAAAPPPPHPLIPIPPGAQPRRGNPQLLSNLAQRPAAARQQPHRLRLELIRVLATQSTHQTPSRSQRSLSEVSTISREGQI